MGIGLSTTLTKACKAEAAVTRRRIVKFGSTDDFVVLGAAAADAVFGISSEIDAVIGEVCDVHIGGVAELEYGGPVTRGALLMADATGRGIVAAAAAGANIRIIGWATVAGVAGDIGSVMISPSSFQG